ncbi:MAG: hypothetical protein KVP17_004290 [Porospora cf. gigantea B]|uniref:uncharacterized protein n=1 Tax=Porospora cf. gigantea B TaxID=2853592 RepID=UPI003571A0EE|nr:MAG: hypothetical protein KVP17_004290 [Porospora cf. gigantea B]
MELPAPTPSRRIELSTFLPNDKEDRMWLLYKQAVEPFPKLNEVRLEEVAVYRVSDVAVHTDQLLKTLRNAVQANISRSEMSLDSFARRVEAISGRWTDYRDVLLRKFLVGEESAFEEPAFEEPAFEEPAFEEPAFEEPAFEEPAFEEPAFDTEAEAARVAAEAQRQKAEETKRAERERRREEALRKRASRGI